SLLHCMPVYVGTSRGNWVVDDDEISLLEAAPAQEPPPQQQPTLPRTPPPSQSVQDANADAPLIPQRHGSAARGRASRGGFW
ncbi:MAG TPA: hypothetical protein VF516_06105, partial [Kofleriaceae bacterium]